MKIVKKIGIWFSAFVIAAMGTQALAADTAVVATQPFKVAVVNVQQVLQQSPRVAQLSKKLESQFKDRQTKINNEQKNLQDEMEKLKKETPTMSAKNRDAMQAKISADRANLVKEVVAYQKDLQTEQNKVMQSILADLNGIVSGIAKTQNYSLVLDSQAVIFAANGNDITKEVSDKFNKE